MVDLLVDMYLYDDDMARSVYMNIDSVSLYTPVLAKHKCTEEQYKAAILYYANEPKKLKSIYEKVQEKLEKQKIEYEKVQDVEDSLRNIWVASYDTLFRSSGVIPENYSFLIPVDTLGTYTITMYAQCFDDDSTTRPRMRGYLLIGDKDADLKDEPKDVTRIKAPKLRPEVVHKNLNLSSIQLDKNLSLESESAELKGLQLAKEEQRKMRQVKEIEFEKGLKKYFLSFNVNDTLITHLKGYWLLVDDSTACRQNIRLSKFSVLKDNDKVEVSLTKIRK
jgi:hypothetical protein